MGNKEYTSREIRRRKRIRSQIMAYTALLIIIAAVAAGGFFGVKAIVRYIENYNEKVDQALAEANTLEEQSVAAASNLEEETQQAQTEEVTEADPLDELVEALLKDMTIEEKVAGMFIVSPESITGVTTVIQAGDGTKEAITNNPVGGILYAPKNFKSEEQFVQMLSNTRSYSKYPLFLAVSRECGDADTFGVEASAKASDIADADSAKAVYQVIADKLSSYGINMNLAPVADIVSEEGNAGLQGRTFGSDGTAAAAMVVNAAAALQEKEISAVLQKFPGEGAVDSNNTGVISKSLEELKNSDFLTYQAAIEGGVDCIMVSNVKAPAIVGDDTPCSLSAVIIRDILRNTLGYKGVVMTDMLKSDAITANHSSAGAAIAAIQAGADVLVEPADYREAYEGVLQAIADGTITQERIHESLYRIYRVKYKNTLDNLQ